MIISLGKCCNRLVGTMTCRIIVRQVYINFLKKEKIRTVPKALLMWSSNTIVNRFLVPFVCCYSESNLNGPHKSNSLCTPKSQNTIVYFISLTWDIVQTILRSIQLMCIFTPILVFYPLVFLGQSCKSLWFKILLMEIEFSGPIITKLGQWASTRKDLFSEELCVNLSKLQHETKPHSWMYTKQCFQKAYGPHWEDLFVCIDNNSIGSGCCAQVYKAWIRKEVAVKLSLKRHLNRIFNTTNEKHTCPSNDVIPVAVKVRHPGIKRLLRQDISILKFLARSLTLLFPKLKWLSLCECVDDFSLAMQGQVDFSTEAKNLDKFAVNFKNKKNVIFPKPYCKLTRSNILVETFEEGEHIYDFVSAGKNEAAKKRLALIGVNTILKMVFEDNFIHGDMHPGNMLVLEKAPNSQFYLPWVPEEPFTLVILDCGIVTTLDERGRKCLKDVFAAVAHSNGVRVAELFLEHSKHECQDPERFKKEMKDLVNQALSKTVTLQQVDVSVLMNALFTTMIHHKVKMDSSFSSVIMSIVVLEGFGRTLDPTIDIVEKAKPFLFSSYIYSDIYSDDAFLSY